MLGDIGHGAGGEERRVPEAVGEEKRGRKSLLGEYNVTWRRRVGSPVSIPVPASCTEGSWAVKEDKFWGTRSTFLSVGRV